MGVPRRSRGRDLITHPVVVVSLVVLALNDQWLKAAHPGWVTGKASDVAGLVVAPAVVLTAWSLARRRRPLPSWAPVVVVAAVGAVFALVQVWGPAGDAYRVAFGWARWPLDAGAALLAGDPPPPVRAVRLWADPWDLLALPALVVPVALARRADRARAVPEPPTTVARWTNPTTPPPPPPTTPPRSPSASPPSSRTSPGSA